MSAISSDASDISFCLSVVSMRVSDNYMTTSDNGESLSWKFRVWSRNPCRLSEGKSCFQSAGSCGLLARLSRSYAT